MKVPPIKDLRKICQESKEGWAQRNWFDKNITRKISIYITYLAIKTGIKPNQITVATLFIGIIGGILIMTGNKIYWILGFLIVYLGVILDAVDGELARFYNMPTELGKYLDLFVGLSLHKFILACMSIALYLETNHLCPLILGAISISAISLSAENMLYINCIANKSKSEPISMKSYVKNVKNKVKILNIIEEHVLRSLFDYCYGFSIFWAFIGVVEVIAQINVKLFVFGIYTLLVVIGCFKNCISSIRLLSPLSKKI